MTQQRLLIEDTFHDVQAEQRAAEARQRRQEAAESERRKREGMQAAAMSKDHLLGYARGLAVDLAKANDGECHADMVAEALKAEGRPGLGNAAGSLFLTHVWEFTGRRVKSQRANAHANELKVWRLKYKSE